MKRKIAVLANGWNNISVTQALKGIRSVTDKLGIDIFLFLSFAAVSQTEARNIGEDDIFDLADYSDFDGVIIFSNMLNSEATPKRLVKRLVEQKVCAVSVGIPYEGLSYVGIDNYKGMYDMVDHLVKEHHIKNPAFLAGARDNADSNERLIATREALAKNGIELKDENVRYTNWEYLTSMRYAMEYCKKPDPPDAFICANDHNALAACIGLNKMGYSVPEDFIVTGFDKLSSAETFFPSITTVFQDYEKIGYVSAWQLVNKLDGTAESDNLTVSTTFVCNESCGCKKTAEAEVRRHRACIESYSNEMENIIFRAREAEMTTSVFTCSSFKEFQRNLVSFYSRENFNPFGQSDEFYFILDDNTYKHFIQSSNPVLHTYSDKMHCLVAVKDGKCSEPGGFMRKELIPGYGKKKKPSVYTFTSMHFDDALFGYIVTSNSLKSIQDRTLSKYMIQLNYNIEQYRKNCHLEEINRSLLNITNTDRLTGLNNRFGMEKNAVPLFEEAHKNGKSCAVVFIDMNRMKEINDNYGHLQGDLAIKTVASVLSECNPEGWIGIRYGGDEFVSVGICNDEKIAVKYIDEVCTLLKKRAEELALEYTITVSCGYALSDPASTLTLFDYVSKADSVMYLNKQKTYATGKIAFRNAP
ncbi:MAG: GGDEF domain-containing protein [Spirochaetaceae bacterium]|nr:GGDEF domain-containing protein [Spirochaetaceae bacterium]